MNALQIIENEFAQIGYSRSGMIRDYTFADVLTPSGQQRSVDLAAFTQTPASYRTAAFGVIREDEPDISQALMGYRALGAPLMLSISEKRPPGSGNREGPVGTVDSLHAEGSQRYRYIYPRTDPGNSGANE